PGPRRAVTARPGPPHARRDPRPRRRARASPPRRAASRGSSLDDGELDAVGVGEGEGAIAPVECLQLVVEVYVVRRDARHQVVEILGGREPQAHGFALLAIAALGEVILAQHQVAGAGLHLY